MDKKIYVLIGLTILLIILAAVITFGETAALLESVANLVCSG